MTPAFRPAPDPTRSSAASPWILDAPRDLLWFIATPLLIVPLIALVQTAGISAAQIGIYVAAFGATGHHLPGFLRAYGDRELLARFRLRFIIAPVLLSLCCVGLANTDLRALGVIVLIWGTWHGLAQVFGVLRIYEAKAKSHDGMTVALDRWLLIAAFGGGLLHSPGRMASLLETLYSAGIPLIAPSAIVGFTTAWDVASVGLVIAFAAHYLASVRRGSPPSPLKIPTLVSSIGFWWYSMVWIDNAILGIALFELFHDVQYMAISWVFNRNRVDKGHRMGGFARFLFRPSATMLALYLAMALLYGYAIHLPGLIESDWIRRSLLGLVATSALLHFYYDGFIWKVRERATRESLGLSGGREVSVSWLHRGVGHGLLWMLFIIPLIGLAWSQNHQGRVSELALRRNVAAAVPSAYSQAKLGLKLQNVGQIGAATDAFRAAVELDSSSAPARNKLGNALREQGLYDEAIEQHRIALSLSDGRWERHDALGQTLEAAGRSEEAVAQYEAALRANPRAIAVQERLAGQLMALGRNDEATRWLREVAQNRPDDWRNAYNLGTALASTGRNDEARVQFERAVELEPHSSQAQQALGRAYRRLGRQSEAQRHLRKSAALRRDEASP